MLKERGGYSSGGDPHNENSIAASGARFEPSRFVTVYRSPDGAEIFREEKVVDIDPRTAQQAEFITRTSRPCDRCNGPITKEMLDTCSYGTCFVCDFLVCANCMANTNLNEYLRPEVRGQTVCKKCWTTREILERLMIHCPSCNQRVRNYSEIKQCAGWCKKALCPSCGIPTETGLACNLCNLKIAIFNQEVHRA